MKVRYTQVVGVESNENNVKISFRPQGSDVTAKPIVISVSPHDSYIHLSLSDVQNRRGFACGGNAVDIKLGEPTKK